MGKVFTEPNYITKICVKCSSEYNTKATSRNRPGKCSKCRNESQRASYEKKMEQSGKPVFAFKKLLESGQKKCTQCDNVKTIESFSKRGQSKYRTSCKTCDSKFNKKYSLLNSEKINYNRRERRKKPETGIIFTQRDRQRSVYNSKGVYKPQACTERIREWLGCSVSECKMHIQNLFTEGMNWKNKGIGSNKWQIDHIIPVSLTQLDSDNNIIDNTHNRAIWHYTNLQPLWHLDNAIKSNKYEKIC